MATVVYDRELTKPDRLVLRNLEQDIVKATQGISSGTESPQGEKNAAPDSPKDEKFCLIEKSDPPKLRQIRKSAIDRDQELIEHLTALNDATDPRFEPTVFNCIDLDQIKLSRFLDEWFLKPYIRLAQCVVRVPTDAVMFTHLLLYFSTSVPSAIYLYYNFRVWHGILHTLMQFSYAAPYTLMMHQHIHMRGILHRRLALFDSLFPYITNPLMGHTWNSYYYHHVKHHHVEGNGPYDLSSTLRYQRDELLDFLHYVGRFYFLVWADLPLYFMSKGRWMFALKTAFWELGSYAFYAFSYRINAGATTCVFLLPLFVMRLTLMVGNWGQHALVDHNEPDSDFRSSITLIDVSSNRHCFNDGYHTSHHLNPLRHWREHPVAFLKAKETYSSQHALVFHNIDYLMLTVRLMMKDYATLAKCMVPIGDQIHMTVDERIALLKSHTKRFTKEEIAKKFNASTKI